MNYDEFLQTDFWKRLSRKKKRQHPACQRCGRTERLESHHVVYPRDWFQTKLEDLEVLCRRCHEEEHGLGRNGWAIYPYTADPLFNEVFHRCNHLWTKVMEGRELRQRDQKFLRMALIWFPRQPNDRGIAFMVEQISKFVSVEAWHV